MRKVGEPDPAAATPSFLLGFRIVGTPYVLGILAIWKRT